MPQSILFTALLAVMSLMVNAQKLNLKKGQQFCYAINERTTYGNYKSDKNILIEYRVLEKKDTTYLFEAKLKSLKYDEVNNWARFILNSQDLNDNYRIDQTTSFISEIMLLNEPFKFTISENINDLNVTDINRVVEKKILKWQIVKGDIPHRDNALRFANVILMATFYKIPENIKPVSGTFWKDTTSNMNYTISGNKKTIDVTGILANIDKNTNDLKSVINSKNGVLILKNERRTNPIIVNNKPFILTKTLNVKEVPHTNVNISNSEGWDMIMKGAFFSNALNSNMELDSLKVMKYINDYKKFSNNKIFVENKLTLLQRINNEDLYDEELKKTPAMLVANTYHLHNKINDEDNSIDSTVFMAKFLDDGGAYGWLQHSFSQDFLYNNNTDFDKNIEILNRLSKDDKVKYYTTPLMYWAETRDGKKTAIDYNAIAQKLTSLDDIYWDKGNAARYSIMVAQELAKIGKNVEAENALDATIQKLTKIYADDQSSRKFVLKAHLANAWYQKYLLSVKNNPSQNNLLHLEKAAFYSPKGKNEKVHDSFYDRIFTKGEEDYANKYNDELALAGQTDQVLKNYISAFATTPTVLYDLKTFYQKNYKDKSFSDLFTTTLMPALKDAPYFELTDLNNNRVTLNDLKGKWNVIDFWGTWCSPCVAEMPKLNKYYNNLKADKNSKINFLTIACNDTREKVVNFLEKRKYNIPVLMSDDKVSTDYGILGYPTKIIITPTGKMIMMDSNYDWESYIKEISSL